MEVDSVFTCRDVKGVTVFVLNSDGYLPKEYDPDVFVASMYILLEVLLEDPKDQQSGISLLVDASGMGLKNFEKETEKRLTDMYQVYVDTELMIALVSY